MNGNANFGIIADFIILAPLLMLLRAAAPRAAAMQIGSTLIGLYLVYTVAPRFLPFYLGFWAIIWALQYAVFAATKSSGALSKLGTAIVLIVALSPMIVWKLWPDPFVNWTTETFAKAIFHGAPDLFPLDVLAPVIAPIGLSFATFRALDVLIKIRLDLLAPLNPLEMLYYGFFAPVLAVGPVIEYEEIRLPPKLERAPKSGDISVGLFRIALGVVKVMIVAFALSALANHWWQGGKADWIAAWGALLVYGFYFYVNFSGYSDLAIGASRLLGLKLKENFNNPCTKTNPQQFWASWHMSLTRWCQRYVFVPLGGMRANRQYIASFATIMAIALWHAISWNMVIFGLFHAAFLLTHRFIENRRIKAKRKLSENVAARALKSFGVFLYVSISIPLFTLRLQDIPEFYAKLAPSFGGSG
ncbi:MAG: MBOAT family O-acyltransferase [Pseudomonadota bacterium]